MTKARDLANASTALSAVSPTELGYLDGVTSAVQTQMDAKLASSTAATTYVANSLADAKGDIFVASADNTVTRLPVGSTGDTIVADSSATTGLRYNPSITAGKNALINGAMDIWQRGTSFTNPGTSGTVFSADRWLHYFGGNGTVTQETTVKPDTSTYSMKITATGSTASNDVYQLIEQLNVEQFRGKRITVSVKLAGTVGLLPELTLHYSTTANTNLFLTNTPVSGTIIQAPAINASTFVTHIYNYDVPSTAQTLRFGILSKPMVNTNVFYIAEAQFEIGSTATTFSRAGGTIQGELAACQRYYFRLGAGCAGIAAGVQFGHYLRASATSTTNLFGELSYPVTMRRTPTAIDFSNVGWIVSWGAGVNAISAITIYDGNNVVGSNPQSAVLQMTTTGAASGTSYPVIANNSTASFIGLSAEL